MATPLGTNDLKIYRRHTVHCPLTKDTLRPNSPRERKADTCRCPIWFRGYLANETITINGKTKPRRVSNSLDTADWAEAEKGIGELYRRGSLPTIAAPSLTIDAGAITVEYAGKRYLESRINGSLNPIEKDTLDHYAGMINDRLIPWCKANRILYIRDFEQKDVCQKFTESWRQQRRNVGELLAQNTRIIMTQRFRTFLRDCMENGWLVKSGADKVKMKIGTTAKQGERHGLELEEYQQLLTAVDSTDLTPLQNQETLAATELMRWTGMRISDAHKFNSSEIIRDQSGTGWNANFIQKKTKKRCVSPLPDHVKSQLDALPGHVLHGKKYFFFSSTYTALRMRIDTLAVRAQKDKPFKHHFSPHCLRHTFAIMHINEATPIELISKWLGHETVAVTLKHYQNHLESTKRLHENVSREAVSKMIAKSSALRQSVA